MDKEERIHASYLHCCLRYVNRMPMNNPSLRERFGIEAKSKSMVSRVIKDALEAGVIRAYDPSVGPKAVRYIPFWA